MLLDLVMVRLLQSAPQPDECRAQQRLEVTGLGHLIDVQS